MVNVDTMMVMEDCFRMRMRMRRAKVVMKKRRRLEFYSVERLRYIVLIFESFVWDIVMDNERFFMVRWAIRWFWRAIR